MSWFFDVNRSIRNGDAMKVIYQAQDGPEQFKILNLSYKSQRFGKLLWQIFSMAWANQAISISMETKLPAELRNHKALCETYTEITSLPGDFRKGLGGALWDRF